MGDIAKAATPRPLGCKKFSLHLPDKNQDMKTLRLSRPHRRIEGTITLAGSKSISNRVLIMKALSGGTFSIDRLANAKDTTTLQALLESNDTVLDAGAAGTTFRFLTAWLCTRPGTKELTGSERMKQRPIGVLVDALRGMGAQIEYIGQEGYPPLRITGSEDFGREAVVRIPASTSSQYITALLMLGPTLPQGLTLTLEGKVVSRPYIEMTLGLMAHFGIRHTWEGQTIHLPHQAWQGRDFVVEADWSAASYYYSLAALSEYCDLQLNGLFEHSVQGDAVIEQLYRRFGVVSTFNASGVHLHKAAGMTPPAVFECDFLACPDVAQTLSVTCAGLGVQALMTGLETLRIKETDRIAALQQELAKVNAWLNPLPARFSGGSEQQYFLQEGQAHWETPPSFATYEDHRMAMAFAPLALLGPIEIQEPDVVVKSYPDFWKDWQALGFEVVG
ncbi:MAG: 3-phosphoshikimate 1-carboxyvinyltransferase [Saprospiraceae bacterium]